jgi:myosin heavy subunit
MAILAAVTGLIKGKQKEKTALDQLSVIDSPVVEKIYNYHVKISNLDSEIESKKSEVRTLQNKLESIQNSYFTSGFDEKVLKETMKIKNEIAELETNIQQMSTAASKRDHMGRLRKPKLQLTAEEKQSLINGYAPLKARREELYQKALEQAELLEKTLDELKGEQHKLHAVFAQLYSFIGMSTEEDMWAITELDGFKGGEIDFKMQQLANKHQFYFNWPLYS